MMSKPNRRYIRPVPGKYQRQARLRRLDQALRDRAICYETFLRSVAQVEQDYLSWKEL